MALKCLPLVVGNRIRTDPGEILNDCLSHERGLLMEAPPVVSVTTAIWAATHPFKVLIGGINYRLNMIRKRPDLSGTSASQNVKGPAPSPTKTIYCLSFVGRVLVSLMANRFR